MRPIEKLIEKRKEEFIRNNLMSDEFIDFIQKNKKPMDKLLSYYACAIMEVETKFRVLDHQYSLEYDRNPIEDIKSRVKSWESLIKKVRRKEIPLTLSSIEENIHDIAGVRVVCSFPDDIYMLADCLLNQDDITLIEKKDYIKNPKPGGYRSLHLIISVPIFLQNEKRMVTVEVQLRTGLRTGSVAALLAACGKKSHGARSEGAANKGATTHNGLVEHRISHAILLMR